MLVLLVKSKSRKCDTVFWTFWRQNYFRWTPRGARISNLKVAIWPACNYVAFVWTLTKEERMKYMACHLIMITCIWSFCHSNLIKCDFLHYRYITWNLFKAQHWNKSFCINLACIHLTLVISSLQSWTILFHRWCHHLPLKKKMLCGQCFCCRLFTCWIQNHVRHLVHLNAASLIKT